MKGTIDWRPPNEQDRREYCVGLIGNVVIAVTAVEIDSKLREWLVIHITRFCEITLCKGVATRVINLMGDQLDEVIS